MRRSKRLQPAEWACWTPRPRRRKLLPPGLLSLPEALWPPMEQRGRADDGGPRLERATPLCLSGVASQRRGPLQLCEEIARSCACSRRSPSAPLLRLLGSRQVDARLHREAKLMHQAQPLLHVRPFVEVVGVAAPPVVRDARTQPVQ